TYLIKGQAQKLTKSNEDSLTPQTWVESPPRETLEPKRGAAASSHDITPASSHHRCTNHRFTGTPSSPQTPSTHVFPLSESINRLFEISSASIHHQHREESFARNITLYQRRASIGTKSRRPKARKAFTPRSQKLAIAELEKPPPPANKAGGDGVVEASTSRNRNLI
ncbi:hypothetical protein HID58_077021, partial [Brassica napus]